MFVRIARSLPHVLVLASFLVPAAASAQNLVQNPNFTAGIATFWTASNDGSCPGCSAALDGTNGFPTAPSARLASTTPGNAGETLTSACTAYTGSTLDLGAFQHTNTASVNAQSQILFFFWSSNTCASGFLGQASAAFIANAAPGWDQFGVVGFAAPAASGFFNVILQARLNGAAAGAADFSYDHVYLGPPGTTPVELESLGVD